MESTAEEVPDRSGHAWTSSSSEQRTKSVFMTSCDDESQPLLFGNLKEQSITFCIDTSGSMYNTLDTIKDHLIRLLRQKSQSADEGDKFNLIEFSTSIVKWADQMVALTPQTVAVASKWIHDLVPKTGTNTREALSIAFDDPDCDAVCLITDSIPDQRTNDVIDVAIQAARNRPVHCFYIQSGPADQAAVAFLRELAMETYGSFHIIMMNFHGILKQVVPVYNAQTTPDGIVRTKSGGIYSSAHKVCSVGTKLDGPPPCVAAAVPTVLTAPVHGPPFYPLWPYHLYPWPYRYYHTLIEGPEWTRCRPAKAWLKHAQDFVSRASAIPIPGAGGLIVGTRVLARRQKDGLFYIGNVKSQLMNDQFLVELGPCKHGKFTDTEYQETYVYDIVSLDDALRHPVLVDDKVLAPWEPEGERYAPGIVIDGQEKRMAECAEPDKPLVVTLYDGKTVTVPFRKAMWIPHDFHERIAFELKLPRNVRKEFAANDCYPYLTNHGYPASGSLAFPPQFERYTSPTLLAATGTYPAGWYGTSCRGYPWQAYYKDDCGWSRGRREPREGNGSDANGDEVIPGTDMTKSQLNSKVMKQIMQNKMAAGGNDSGVQRRETTQNTVDTLRKSVSFADLKIDDDAQLDASDARDSGHGSQVDLNISDEEFLLDDDDVTKTRDVAVGTDASKKASLFRKSRSKSAQPGKKWKYWRNDPAPSMTDPLHYGPYRAGTYRDCADFPSILLRSAKKNWADTVEWTSPMGRVVDTRAQYKYRPDVNDCMHVTQPPTYHPDKQAPGRDISDVLGTRQRSEDQLAELRRNYRQQQVLAREIGWQRRVADEEHAKQQTVDLRRRQVEAQIAKENARVNVQIAEEQNRLAAKRAITQQLQDRYRQNVDNYGEKDARRLAAMSVNRVNRNLQAARREAEANEAYARQMAVKEVNRVGRIEANLARMSELDRQEAARYDSHVRAQAAQTAHFVRKENEAQRRKEYASMVNDQAQAIFRSQVIP